MKESELYPPVRDWLQAQGYAVYVEHFDCDVIGLRPDPMADRGMRVVVVELKTGNPRDLAIQIGSRCQWADEAWGAVPPGVGKGHKSMFADYGIGILDVKNGVARVRWKAKPQPWGRIKMRRYRLGQLATRGPAQAHELAGLPACAALREQRQARKVIVEAAKLPEVGAWRFAPSDSNAPVPRARDWSARTACRSFASGAALRSGIRSSAKALTKRSGGG